MSNRFQVRWRQRHDTCGQDRTSHLEMFEMWDEAQEFKSEINQGIQTV